MDIVGTYNGERVHLSDICFQPLAPDNKECTVLSVIQYYQLNKTLLNRCITNTYENCRDNRHTFVGGDWHDQFIGCTR